MAKYGRGLNVELDDEVTITVHVTCPDCGATNDLDTDDIQDMVCFAYISYIECRSCGEPTLDVRDSLRAMSEV